MAKFKVGDKVRVRKDLVGDSYYERNGGNEYCGRKLYCNRHMTKQAGKVFTIRKVDEYAGEYELEGTCWYWSDDMLELVSVGFTKADLKDGMVVEYRNGKRRMVLGDIFTNDGFLYISEYDDNLIHNDSFDSNPDLDIVKVYKSSARVLPDWFKDIHLTLIWERGEEHKEMTVAEIEEKLGYKIKVIADKE